MGLSQGQGLRSETEGAEIQLEGSSTRERKSPLLTLNRGGSRDTDRWPQVQTMTLTASSRDPRPAVTGTGSDQQSE